MFCLLLHSLDVCTPVLSAVWVKYEIYQCKVKQFIGQCYVFFYSFQVCLTLRNKSHLKRLFNSPEPCFQNDNGAASEAQRSVF